MFRVSPGLTTMSSVTKYVLPLVIVPTIEPDSVSFVIGCATTIGDCAIATSVFDFLQEKPINAITAIRESEIFFSF